jgi:hypothetical protein
MVLCKIIEVAQYKFLVDFKKVEGVLLGIYKVSIAHNF